MPAFPFARTRVTAGGTAGASDSWSIGLTLATPDAPTAAQLSAWCEAANTYFHNWWNGGSPSVNSICPSDYLLTQIRAYYYATGSTTADVVGAYDLAAPINGAQDKTQPSDECLVATLLSGRAGRHGRGRIYIPAGGGSLTNHQRTSDDVNAVAHATSNLIEGLNGTSVDGWDGGLVVIGSPAGSSVPVSSVRVDSVPDVQRRRQFKMVPIAVGSHAVALP